MNNLNRALSPRQAATNQAIESNQVMGNLFLGLKPISLEQTNELASMQSRIDNKYLVNFDQFSDFLNSIKPQYKVLEIGDKRQFRYNSCYYDENFCCYYEHHQGRRQRLKVRTREYVDGGGMKYLEIKLKGIRGQTVKHRCETDKLFTRQIEGEQLRMLRDLYARQYKKEMQLDLRPALLVAYKRCTLVAMAGGERVTVDYQLSFAKPDVEGTALQLGSDFIVIETKSADGRGTSDTALKRQKVRQASRCSKYCIGVNLTGSVTRNNNFLATIKQARRNIASVGQTIVANYQPLGLAG